MGETREAATARPARPIIVTLQLDAGTAAFFDRQREAHFPPAINYIGAHLTLFHNLPGGEIEAVVRSAARVCAGRAPFEASVCGLMKLGRGVAYRVEAPALSTLRADLAAAYEPWLIRQDRQRFRPHVTIQNKVAPEEALALYEQLSSAFEPFAATAEGLQFWFYEGGPNRPGTWAPAGALAFQST